jgi:hypothetical protein
MNKRGLESNVPSNTFLELIIKTTSELLPSRGHFALNEGQSGFSVPDPIFI